MLVVKSAVRSISFSAQAIEMFAAEMKKHGTVEAGGVLLGRLENGVAVIAKATDGGPNAIHEEFFFQADPNYVDMLIDMEYANSGGKNVYLGEWHTHPQTKPEPSPKDLRSLEEIADSAEEFAILLILGAIDFDPSRISEHYFSIIKYNVNENFYKLKLIE